MKTLSLLLCLLSLLFCSEKSTENPNDVVEISFTTDPTSLDPVLSTDLTTEKLIRLLNSTLYTYDKAGSLQNNLAVSSIENYETLSLDVQIKNQVSAEDVVQSIYKLIQTPGPRKETYNMIQSIEKLKVGNTVRFNLKKNYHKNPKNIFHSLKIALSFPAASIQNQTGAYNLDQWKKGNSLKLVSNPKFFEIFQDKKGKLPKNLNIHIIPQSTSAIFLFSKNKLDALKLSDFLLNHNLTKKNQVIAKKGRSVQYVAINHNNECFDQNFREAVNLAIDREKIIDKILENQAELTLASIPISRLGDEYKNNKQYLPQFSLMDAKALLEKSKCYPSLLNQELDFRMRGDDENQSKGRAVAEALRQLGLKIKIKGMEKAILYKENGMGLGDFTFLTWYADYESPMAFLDPVFHSAKVGNAGNRAFYKNSKLDESLAENDIQTAISILVQDKPWIFLWSIQENYLISKKIINYPELLDYL
ncbi:ABC transporter substrate-binding protein [Leptospira sp. GIMC2001]|uniref:ABC transporter substrate-binding protein n=1 Tax=Leptospira sp. GIMC2001 TaxID=1513297 RepID=UPI00234916AF|nr:ABC transporter substrate-binding protein [Leptospira sp. GIMC2001]WCL50395.1 ABC transporter substrate-binding protein [Leptospira sp. GIMC2001]